MTNGEISFDVFSKPINIVLLSTCYPKKAENVPKGMALR